MPNRGTLLRGLVPCLCALLAACEGSSPGPEPTEEVAVAASSVMSRGRQHLLVTVELTDGGARVVDARTVDAPLPRSRPPVGAKWHVEVQDAAGKVLFRTDVRPADAVTGEFPSDDGTLERTEARQDVSVVALRVPALADAATIAFTARSLALHPSDRRRQPHATVDDDALVALGTVGFPEVTP